MSWSISSKMAAAATVLQALALPQTQPPQTIVAAYQNQHRRAFIVLALVLHRYRTQFSTHLLESIRTQWIQQQKRLTKVPKIVELSVFSPIFFYVVRTISFSSNMSTMNRQEKTVIPFIMRYFSEQSWTLNISGALNWLYEHNDPAKTIKKRNQLYRPVIANVLSNWRGKVWWIE